MDELKIHQSITSNPRKNKMKINDEFSLNSSASSKSTRRDSYQIRKAIKDKVDKYDFESEIILTPKVKQILTGVQEFEFDIFELNKATNGNEMIVLSTYLLNKHNLFVNWAIDPSTFNQFITCIQNRYVDIAYHNKTHGADVCRLAYYYSTSRNLMEEANLSELDLWTLIIGGAIHDFEHLGWNNAFLIETQHQWALNYNDVSVCENHHIAAAFKMVKERAEWNIFEHLSAAEFKEMRKKLTTIVISTDMALHNEHIKQMKDYMVSNDFDPTEESNQLFLMSMCLHVADLTNPSKRWMESYKWAWLVYEEFFVQGDKELELGIPVSAMTDRLGTNIATAQLGFIDFVIQPTFEVFVDFLPSVQVHLDQLSKNRKKWDSLQPEWKMLQANGNDWMKKFYELDEDEYKNSEDEDHQNDTGKKTSDIVDLLEDPSENASPNLPKPLPPHMEGPTLENRIETENNA